MNTLIIKPEEIVSEGRAKITGQRAIYVYDFHHLKVGIEISCAVLNGQIGTAKILSISREQVDLEFVLNEVSAPLSNITVLLALPRPQIVKKVLSVVCELGVSKLIFFAGQKSFKSYSTASVLQKNEIEYFLVKGLEQSCSTILPDVQIVSSLNAALQVTENLDLKIFAEGSAVMSLKEIKGNQARVDQAPTGVALAIGPEAGWDSKELDLLQENGFQGVALGSRTLRVDTALTYLVAQINALFD